MSFRTAVVVYGKNTPASSTRLAENTSLAAFQQHLRNKGINDTDNYISTIMNGAVAPWGGNRGPASFFDTEEIAQNDAEKARRIAKGSKQRLAMVDENGKIVPGAIYKDEQGRTFRTGNKGIRHVANDVIEDIEKIKKSKMEYYEPIIRACSSSDEALSYILGIRDFNDLKILCARNSLSNGNPPNTATFAPGVELITTENDLDVVPGIFTGDDDVNCLPSQSTAYLDPGTVQYGRAMAKLRYIILSCSVMVNRAVDLKLNEPENKL
jgi:hypothetical protein